MESLNDKSVDEFVRIFGTVMIDLLDCHCPVVTVQRRFRPITPWFDVLFNVRP